MRTIRHDGLRELGHELFPHHPHKATALYLSVVGPEMRCIPSAISEQDAREIVEAVGHTILYINKDQCIDQKVSRFPDEKLEKMETVFCFLPITDEDNKPTKYVRLYLLPLSFVKLYKSLIVPALG